MSANQHIQLLIELINGARKCTVYRRGAVEFDDNRFALTFPVLK